MGKFGIFLGSFNPPHIGHVNVIQEVYNNFVNTDYKYFKTKLFDGIFVIPAYQNPNKDIDTSNNYTERYLMCKSMFEGIPKVQVNLIESIYKPKYTYELFDILRKEYPDTEFTWIITDETMLEIIQNKWKHSDELLKNNKFLIIEGAANYSSEWTINSHLAGDSRIDGSRYTIYRLVKPINISSTAIRLMLENKECPIPYINKECFETIKI